MTENSGHAIPKTLAAAIVIAFSLAWGASSAYAVLAERPLGTVYVVEPWPSSESLLGGGCLNGLPVVVASRGSMFEFDALVYTPNWSVAIEDFNPQAYCVSSKYIVVAGSYNETPALALVRGPYNVTILSITGVGSASLNAVRCGEAVAAAGSSVGGTIILRLAGNNAEAWLVGYPAPVLSVLSHAGEVYVLTASGVIVLGLNGSARLHTPRLANATWENIVRGAGGVWLTGGITYGNASWAVIAPLEGGEALLLRAEGYDGFVLDARSSASRQWIVYYRPGSYWDCLARVSGSTAHGVKLLWTGPHDVVSASIDENGYAVTATLVSGARRYVVIACIGSVEEAHYWLGDSSVMHASPIPITERLLVSHTPIPPPDTTKLTTRKLAITEFRVHASPTASLPIFRKASLKWDGPLVALTYVALSIVMASALWRGFVGGGLEA
jgi:hypothetical protein